MTNEYRVNRGVPNGYPEFMNQPGFLVSPGDPLRSDGEVSRQLCDSDLRRESIRAFMRLRIAISDHRNGILVDKDLSQFSLTV